MTELQRQPAGFARSSDKSRRKWEPIISAFLAGDFETLRSIQRTGTRGRIAAVLVRQCFDVLNIRCQSEPIFPHVPPDAWYADFAAQHGLKLRTHDHYNPDFLLEDGTWVEVTLSENTAYQKLFRYGHQAPGLLLLWLDPDYGLHKQVCEGIAFPNAHVRPVDWYYPRLAEAAEGRGIMAKMEVLKGLRRRVL